MAAESPAFLPPDHDHQRCLKSMLARAEQVCRERGGRLTPIRRQVLELVWSSHQAVGAYQISEQLARQGGSPAPMTVYRALDFLLEHGLIHRLPSRNAFVGCPDPGAHASTQFLICRGCRAVAEIHAPGLGATIRDAAAQAGFEVEQRTLEVEGICRHCRQREGS